MNDIAIKNYKSLGFKAGYSPKELFPKSLDINVVGGSILEVHYPKSIVNKLWGLVKQYGKKKVVPPEKLNELLNSKCDIKMVCLKNKQAADLMREKLVSSLKNPLK